MSRAKAGRGTTKASAPYGEDLAFIHDAGFGHMARSAAEVLLHERKLDLGSKTPLGRFVDLGCGSGILSEHMAAAGYDVTGIDLSQAMLALARERVPAGDFRQGSILSEELPGCEVAAAVGEIVNYLFDESHNLSKVSRLFRRVWRVLSPKGLFLVDGATPGRGLKPGGYQAFREGPGWFCAFHAVESENPPVLTRSITTFREKHGVYRREDEVHRLRLLEPKWVEEQLKYAGFRVRRLNQYASTQFPAGYFAFLATKRGVGTPAKKSVVKR